MCPFGCNEPDTLEHCMVCNKLYQEETCPTNMKQEDIFSENVYKQAAVIKLKVSLLERRDDASSSTTGPGCSPAEDSNQTYIV